MTNAEKMRELVGAPDATEKQMLDWAYMNRVYVCDIPNEAEFVSMKASVDAFEASEEIGADEEDTCAGFYERSIRRCPMPDLTPSEAAAHLRHVSDLFCTPVIKQAALMGAEALEVIAAIAVKTESPTDRKEQTL